MTREHAARLVVFGLALGAPAAVLAGDWVWGGGTEVETVVLRGKMAREGGWAPEHLVLAPGAPIRLRLTSDDVMHGFGVGHTDLAAVDVPPGRFVETTLTLPEPGTYVFYCTRWCGPDHWRMRGTIEVRAADGAAPVEPTAPPTPLYVTLGLDLDAPRAAATVPQRTPSAQRGAAALGSVPKEFLAPGYYRAHSPATAWSELRESGALRDVADAARWDVVAAIWRYQTSSSTLARGAELFSANCAACHGVGGRGDGVMARALSADSQPGLGHGHRRPADFTDPRRMLAASPALLHGKVQRGGMGTGMPNWGPILTDQQTWTVVAYLWTFQFALGPERNGPSHWPTWPQASVGGWTPHCSRPADSTWPACGPS